MSTNNFLSKRYDRDSKSNSARSERHWHGLGKRVGKTVPWDKFFQAFATLMEEIANETGNRHVFKQISDMFHSLDPDIMDEYVANFHSRLNTYGESDSKYPLFAPCAIDDLRLRIGQVGRQNFFTELTKFMFIIFDEEGRDTISEMLMSFFEAMGPKNAHKALFRLHRILDKYDPTKKAKNGGQRRRKKGKQPNLQVISN